jgi:hypothetical protein
MASIGKYAWIPFVVAGLGNILSGWFSAWMLERGVCLMVCPGIIWTLLGPISPLSSELDLTEASRRGS